MVQKTHEGALVRSSVSDAVPMVPRGWDIGPTIPMGPSPLAQLDRPFPWAFPRRATSIHTYIHTYKFKWPVKCVYLNWAAYINDLTRIPGYLVSMGGCSYNLNVTQTKWLDIDLDWAAETKDFFRWPGRLISLAKKNSVTKGMRHYDTPMGYDNDQTHKNSSDIMKASNIKSFPIKYRYMYIACSYWKAVRIYSADIGSFRVATKIYNNIVGLNRILSKQMSNLKHVFSSNIAESSDDSMAGDKKYDPKADAKPPLRKYTWERQTNQFKIPKNTSSPNIAKAKTQDDWTSPVKRSTYADATKKLSEERARMNARVNRGNSSCFPCYLMSMADDRLEMYYVRLNSKVERIYYLISICLLYTSPSPRDRQKSRMPSSA